MHPDIEALLTAPLELTKKVLKEQLAILDTHRVSLGVELARTRIILSKKKAQYLMPVMSGRTELDRRSEVAAETADVQFEIDYLETLLASLDAKIALGTAFLGND